MKKLHSLRAAEVSLVPKGANGKRFAILKADTAGTADDPIAAAAVESVRSTSPTLIERIKKTLKTFGKKPEEQGDGGGEGGELSREAQTALEATARILAPHKDEITDDHLDAIQEQVGIAGGTHDETAEGGEGDDVKPEHMQGAKEAAEKSYKDHLEKLGYQKYPEGELTMKGKSRFGADADGDADEGDDEEDEEGDDVSKENNQPVKVLKEDGTLNIEAAPAESRPFLEHIAKEMKASQDRAVAAEKRADTSETVVKELLIKNRRAELVAKAASFKNLENAHVLTMLEIADGAGKEKFDIVCKGFEAQDAQIAESKLFSQIGSPLPRSNAGGSSSDIMTQVEKTVEGIVQKSAESGVRITKEQAMADYLMAHPELYAQEKSRREASHPAGA